MQKEINVATRMVTECDFCKNAKNGTIQWYVLFIDKGVLHIAKYEDVSVNVDGEVVTEKKEVCGIPHADIYIKRFMDHGSMEDKVTESLPDPEPRPE